MKIQARDYVPESSRNRCETEICGTHRKHGCRADFSKITLDFDGENSITTVLTALRDLETAMNEYNTEDIHIDKRLRNF